MERAVAARALGATARPEIDRIGIANLSTREEQVLSFAAAGYLDKQIGIEMGVSLNTLRTYWQRIRSKIGEAPRSALAVAYSEHVAAESKAVPQVASDCDWEIDLQRSVIVRISDRPLDIELPIGAEIALEEVLSHFHPGDQSRLRSTFASVQRGELDAFTYTARIITPEGMVSGSSFVQVVRDGDGRPVKAEGRKVSNIDLRSPAIGRVAVGYWSKDLIADKFSGDESFCSIFDVSPDDPDLREAAMRRFHPDEVAGCRAFVTDAVAARRTHSRRTHRLVYDDGSIRWITTDLRVEYDGSRATRALGAVMAFD